MTPIARVTRSGLFIASLALFSLNASAGEVHDAVAIRDLARLDQALKDNPKQVNARCFPNFTTPLLMAVEVGEPALVKRLLEAGADPTSRDLKPSGLSPLQRAAIAAGPEYSGSANISGSPPSPGASVADYQKFRNAVTRVIGEKSDQEKAARLEILKLLLDTKPELNERIATTSSPLHLAASFGTAEMVRLLIRSGADVNARDFNWNTPLFYAAHRGEDGEIITDLLSARADIDACGKNDITPLMTAAFVGSRGTVELLLAKGANLEAEDDKRLTALSYAARGGHDDMVDFLYQKGGRDFLKYADKESALMWAIVANSKRLLEILLKEGADIETRDRTGNTPLLLAAAMGRSELSRLLIEKGANRGARTKDFGLFEAACSGGDLPLVKDLMADEGAGKNASAQLVCDVALQGRAEVLELLLLQGGDVSGKSPSGETPLFSAITSVIRNAPANNGGAPSAEEQQLRTVEILLKHGAKVNEPKGTTPTIMDTAARFCGAKIVAALLRAGGNLNEVDPMTKTTPLQAAAVEGRAETARILLDAGADSKKLLEGQTLLCVAAFHGNSGVLKELLAERLPMEEKEPRHGSTALHLATFTNSLEGVEALLAAGASPDALDAKGRYPLLIAVDRMEIKAVDYKLNIWAKQREQMANDLDRLRIIHLLLKYGAQMDHGPGRPVPFLEWAEERGTPEIMELLRNPPAPKRKKPQR